MLVTKGAMYETWDADAKRVIVDIPDGIPVKHYAGAWYEAQISESASALVDLDMTENL